MIPKCHYHLKCLLELISTMPHCSNCNSLKTRLGNDNLCAVCRDLDNTEMSLNQNATINEPNDTELSNDLLNSSLSDITIRK